MSDNKAVALPDISGKATAEVKDHQTKYFLKDIDIRLNCFIE